MPVYIKRRAEWEDTFMCFLNTDVIATGSDENAESKWERLSRSPLVMLMLLLYIHILPCRWLYILSWTSHGRILGYPQTTDSSGMDSFAPILKIDGLNWAFNVPVSCFVSHFIYRSPNMDPAIIKDLPPSKMRTYRF